MVHAHSLRWYNPDQVVRDSLSDKNNFSCSTPGVESNSPFPDDFRQAKFPETTKSIGKKTDLRVSSSLSLAQKCFIDYLEYMRECDLSKYDSTTCCASKTDGCREEQEVSYPFLGNGLSEEEKIRVISSHFHQILLALGLDMEDHSLQKTPDRYAEMLVRELFQGLDDTSFPTITTQPNTFGYREPLLQSQIAIHSVCEHHFVPFLGYCHIAYIPKKRVVGLSKLNRIVHHFARRPQVQERLTRQIRCALSDIAETPDVAVVIDAMHLCVRMRGIQDQDARTRTLDMQGAFLEEARRSEFFASIPKLSDLRL